MEIISPCPTGFGRRNKMPQACQLHEYMKIRTVRRDRTQTLGLDPVDLNISGNITIGEFIERQRTPLRMIYSPEEMGGK